MADLNPLIRVRKHAIEQKQKALAELYRQADELKNQRDALETQLAIESEKTKDMDAEMMSFFGSYAKSARTRIEEIDVDREKLEQCINMAQDDIREAFADMKKIEIVERRRAEEEIEVLEKKESDELDEIAIDAFRRQKGD